MNKRIVSILLLVVFLVNIFSVLPITVCAATNHTLSEAMSWCESVLGQTLNPDGLYPGECVDLILAYYDYLVGGHSGVSGNAYEYVSNRVPNGFTRIQGATPRAGDICISTGGDWGHVWIQGEGNISYHSNHNYEKIVKRVENYSNSSFWGVIRPDFKSEITTFSFDVNAMLDSVAYDGGINGATFSVYINNSLVASNVTDYYQNHQKGTTYKVVVNSPTGCLDYSGSTTLTGTINADVALTISYKTQHKNYAIKQIITNATCTSAGSATYFCGCGKNSYIGDIPSLGHNYQKKNIAATCTEDAYTLYTCSRCGDSYHEIINSGNYTYGDWSVTAPIITDSNITIETKKQYRASTKSLKTSSSSSENGWTLEGSEWKQVGSGTHYYFAKPSGVKADAYTNYATAALSSTQTSTTKREVSSPVHNSYIYYHWAYPTTYGVGGNCYIGTYEGDWDSHYNQAASVWETFESTTDLTERILDSDTSIRYVTYGKYSYWWVMTETYKQTYKDFQLQYTLSKWSDYSSWQDSVILSNNSTRVETRTLYRTKTAKGSAGFGHSFSSGVCMRCGKYCEKFVDISPEDYYFTPIYWAFEKGVTTGISDTAFAPRKNCTRGEIVTFLWRIAGEPEPKSENNPFVDVKTSSYYYKAVLWAIEKGITAGTSKNTFSPSSVCTRGQAVTFLWRANGSPDAKFNSNFTDVDYHQYYANAVLWAVEKGITNGTTSTSFNPNGKCTRGQIVTFLHRSYHLK